MTCPLHKYAPRPTLSHRSQDIPEQHVDRKLLMYSELLAQTDPLLLTWMSLSLLFVLVFYDVTARCVRMSNPPPAHHLCSRISSLSLCLSDTVSVGLQPCFSRQGFLDSHSDSLSEFISTRFCRFSLRCKQRVSGTTSSVSVCFKIRRET